MIQLDVAKAGAQLFSLNNVFNARVHDGFTPMKVQWINSTDGNKPLDVKGMKAFLKGQIGQGTITDDHVELEPKSDLASWADDGSGSQPNGVTLIKLPPQVFTRDGIFYGYIGLADANGTVITSINIWFNVDQNIMTAGANVPYYLDEIQAALSAVQESTDTLQRAKQEIDSQIYLSSVTFEPEAFENEAALKATYPNGKSGLMVTVDTGHKWLWVNSAWRDCGVYQAAGVDDTIAARVTAATEQTKREFDKELGRETADRIAGDQQLRSDLDRETKERNNLFKKIRLDENKEHNNLYNDLYSRIEILPKVTYGKYEAINIIDADGNTIENLGEDIYTFDFDKINGDYHEQKLLKQLSTQKFKYWGQLPVLELNNLPQKALDYGADKSVKVEKIPYYFLSKNLSGFLDWVKIQGNTSVNFPKKNYTLKFNAPVVLHESWGAHTKYVIKSNFNDASQIRNLLAAKTWGNIIKSRLPETLENINLGDDILTDKDGNAITGSSDRVMAIGKNYGAIDGYPITLFINGKFHGIYNLCIPKDNWMADMSHSTEAIVSANQDFAQSQAQFFKGTPDFNGDFEIEWAKNDDGWVKPSIIQAVNAVKADYDSDEAYYNNINEYIDIDSAIDYFIFCALLDNTDGVGKNYLLDTFDKKRWHFTAYDMDNVIGVFKTWNGTALSWRGYSGFDFYAKRHRMFEVILKHMKDRLIKRYKTLRNNALSFATLYDLTMDLYGSVPQYVFNAEFVRWPLEPTTSIRTADQIIFWLDKRLQFLDDEIKWL